MTEAADIDKALKITGPVEWEEAAIDAQTHTEVVGRYLLKRHCHGRVWRLQVYQDEKWHNDAYVTDHHAHALIEKHLRDWLCGKKAIGIVGPSAASPGEWAVTIGVGPYHGPIWYRAPTLLAALIAAVLEVRQASTTEGKSDG